MGGGASSEKKYVLRAVGMDESNATPTSPDNAAAAAAAPGSPPGALVKQASMQGAGSLSPSTTPNRLSKSGSKMGLSPQKSTSKLNRGTSMARGGLRASTRASWLLKEGELRNQSLESFEYGRVIGKGLMGTVRIAKCKQNGFYVAIKSIRKDYVQRHNDHRHINNEKTLLQSTNCPFCIKMFGTFQDAVHIHYVLELAVGGELFRRLGKKGSFPPAVAKFYASEIFCALRHVQSLGYVYRDLKPENVMLDEDGHCKLVDFGFSARPDANGFLHTNCGTPAYLSPEQLNGKFTNGYTCIVDWWSFGILLYELLTGNTPFSKNTRETSYAIYLRILENKISFPYGFDPVTKDLVQQLCHADTSRRLTDPEEIAASKYWEIPWDLVNARKLIPPHVPRLNEPGESSHFDVYRDGDRPMEGVSAASSTSSATSTSSVASAGAPAGPTSPGSAGGGGGVVSPIVSAKAMPTNMSEFAGF